MRFSPHVCLCLLALLGMGCSSPLPSTTASTTTTVEPSPTTSSTDAIEHPTALRFRVEEFAKTLDLSEQKTASCEFEQRYPQLEQQTGITEAARLAINQEIAKVALVNAEAIGATTTVRLETVAEQYLETCTTDIHDIQAEFANDDMGPILEWYQLEDFSVPFNQDGVFVVSLSSEAYSGGAHGSHNLRSLNFDTKTGKRLRIGDIIQRDHLQDFFKEEARLLVAMENDESYLFPEAKDAFERISQQTAPVTSTQLDVYAAFENFSITDAGIMTEYDPYEIAPYSSGMPSAELSWDKIGKWVREDSVVHGLLP